MIIIETLFWFSLFVLAYSYTIYPLLLLLFARIFGKQVQRIDGYCEQAVAVLVPAHNEEKVIEKKIDNVLALDYPSEKLSVWVGSDYSNDKTETIVKSYDDNRVHLWRASKRGGKTGVINGLAPLIDADVILFTDANTMHRADCLKLIMRNFADEQVGGVAGHIEHAVVGEEEMGESVYRGFESRQKYCEGVLHSTISAFGGFYAIRKRLFTPIPPNAYSNDDVLIPMNVIRQGYRVIYEPEAVSTEDFTGSVHSEFQRRVRIGAGNFQAFFWLLDFFNPMKGWPAFCLVSHKFTRWFSPLFLLLLIVCNMVLFFRNSQDIYRILFATGFITVASGMLHSLIKLPITRHVYYFLAMNIALLMGLFRFLGGIRNAAWSRTERLTS